MRLLEKLSTPSSNSFWSRADGKLHVQWYRASGPVRFDPHIHAEFNIAISLAGAVETAQLGVAETIEPGEAMMGSNPGIEHASVYRTGSHGCEAVNLTFAPELLRDLVHNMRRGLIALAPPAAGAISGALEPVFLGKVQSPTLVAAARDIVAELNHRAPGFETVVEGLATRVLIEALRAWPWKRVELLEIHRSPVLSRRDHIRAVEFMRWCRKDEFRVQHLCRYLATSEERFTRLFRSATGATPAHFYNRLLLARGRELLSASPMAVKEVSYELGFRTPSHFVAAFRREFGQTPQSVRTGLTNPVSEEWINQ
ncbi:MAG: helix-turn-helix domain-containing protein [Bryobacterales bacterium]|nr:helix-turn-helix domain-containing protein [Bryobacterales bacterium]